MPVPRDCLPPADAELALPGQRRARVVPADTAGEVRLVVQDGVPLDKLLKLGWVDQGEHAAGVALLQQFEASGLRQRMGGSYSGVVVDHSDVGSPLEQMDSAQLAAWRRLGRLLNQIPPQ